MAEAWLVVVERRHAMYYGAEATPVHVRFALLTLPIHKRSIEVYHRDHDRFVEQQKPAVEGHWGRPFEELEPHIRIQWQDQWYWPPWFFNDIVGYVQIGPVEAGGLGGEVYLRRRHFPLTAPERFSRRRHHRTKDLDQVLYFDQVEQRSPGDATNAEHAEAVLAMTDEAERLVRSSGRGTRQARVWRPAYDLEVLDFRRALASGVDDASAPG